MYDGTFLLKHIAEGKKKNENRKELLYNGTVNQFLALLQHK